MREHIEEGVLQSYVDDELSAAMAEQVATHVAACSNCAEALDEIRNEMALFATAFEAEMAQEVPTLRLRERLDAAIAELNPPAQIAERKQGWSLAGWFASFTEFFKVSPQRALGFASLIAIIAFAAVFAALRLNRVGQVDNGPAYVADNGKPAPTDSTAITKPSPSPTTPDESKSGDGGKKDNTPPKSKAPKKQSKPILVPQPDQLPQDVQAKTLPGEQNYLKAIDSLMTEIEASDATAMKPSLRVEYERNLAVINQAIDSTRRVARRNPKDGDAVQFLYSSYQSKLDLLSTVAEQMRPTVATR